MNDLIDQLKRGLFNKGPEDPLTIVEHALIRDFKTGNILKRAAINIEDEDFWDSMQAYAIASDQKKAVMRNLALRLEKENSPNWFYRVTRKLLKTISIIFKFFVSFLPDFKK
jgi:hypothetical protein